MNDDTHHASDPYGRQLNEYFSAWARALQQAIAPGQGAQLLTAIATLARVIEIDELERRLTALEEKQ